MPSSIPNIQQQLFWPDPEDYCLPGWQSPSGQRGGLITTLPGSILLRSFRVFFHGTHNNRTDNEGAKKVEHAAARNMKQVRKRERKVTQYHLNEDDKISFFSFSFPLRENYTSDRAIVEWNLFKRGEGETEVLIESGLYLPSEDIHP